MSRENIITISFPAVIILLISLIHFYGAMGLASMEFKGIFIVELIVVFPISFLLQGILCALNKTNIVLALAVSLVAYLIIVFIFMNSSALVYILYYSIFWGIGFGITQLIKKVSKK